MNLPGKDDYIDIHTHGAEPAEGGGGAAQRHSEPGAQDLAPPA